MNAYFKGDEYHQGRSNAWGAVAAQLTAHNPNTFGSNDSNDQRNGTQCALDEIKRLQALDSSMKSGVPIVTGLACSNEANTASAIVQATSSPITELLSDISSKLDTLFGAEIADHLDGISSKLSTLIDLKKYS
jgi:hypothetical protein